MPEPLEMIQALRAVIRRGQKKMPRSDLENATQFSEWLLEKPIKGELGHHQSSLGFFGAFLVLEALNCSYADAYFPDTLIAELTAFMTMLSHPFVRTLLRIQWVDVFDEDDWNERDIFDELGRSNEQVFVDEILDGAGTLKSILISPHSKSVENSAFRRLLSLISAIDRISRSKKATCEDQMAFHKAVGAFAEWLFENDDRLQIHLSPALRSQTSNRNVAHLLNIHIPEFDLSPMFKQTFLDTVCLIGALKTIDAGGLKHLGAILASLSDYSNKLNSWFAGQAMKVARDANQLREFIKGMANFEKESGINRWQGEFSLTNEERDRLRTWQKSVGKTIAVCARIIRKLNRHDKRILLKATLLECGESVEIKYGDLPEMRHIWRYRKVAVIPDLNPHSFAIGIWYQKFKDEKLFQRTPEEIIRRTEHARRDLTRLLKAKA